MTPREPDRYDKAALEIWGGDFTPAGFAAALRAEAADALERAAQAFAESPTTQHSGTAVASVLRYLKSPAAAPAAETRKMPRVPELEPQSWCGVPIAPPSEPAAQQKCPHGHGNEPCFFCDMPNRDISEDDIDEPAPAPRAAPPPPSEPAAPAERREIPDPDGVRNVKEPAAAPAAETCPFGGCVNDAPPSEPDAPAPPVGLVEALEKVHGMGCGNIATHRIPAPAQRAEAPDSERDRNRHNAMLVEAWRGEFGALCNALFPSHTGMIGWKHIHAKIADREALLRECEEALELEGYGSDPDGLIARIRAARTSKPGAVEGT